MSKFKCVFYSLIIFSIISIVSCSTETDVQTKNTVSEMRVFSTSQNVITPEKYAYYHNAGTLLYDEKILINGEESNSKSIKTMIDEISGLLKANYPEDYEDGDFSAVYDFYSEYDTKADYNFVEKWNAEKKSYISDGRVPQKLADLVDKSLKENYDYSAINRELEILKKDITLSSKDQISINVFQEVIGASNDLWNGTSNVALASKKRNWCNHQCIIADGMTGLICWYLGPFGADAAMVSSLITASTGDCS